VIDGISLTVNAVTTDTFAVAIIPHTLERTILTDARIGTRVNIETDLLAKYVLRLFPGHQSATASPQGALTFDFLAKHGFL